MDRGRCPPREATRHRRPGGRGNAAAVTSRPTSLSEEVTLIDDAGVERRFTLHDAFDLDGVTFYLVEDTSDPDRVLLLRETEGGLETVDADEFKRVMEALEEDRVE
ncbi:MAG: DUF1292 domain-containing protein [Chloroflexi bacterium]|nr:MAG: DUF1292 domain-containing protein [Chloroflexota bacterium]TMF32707.1 MAG: DUF1292 domain-containing protein [Chloroflexota bacterium]